MSYFPTLQGAVSIADPFNPANVLRPNADGSINVTAGSVGAPSVVGGAVADGVAISGNPVPVGAKYELSPTTFVDGSVGYLHIGSRGALRVESWMPSTAQPAASAADNADAVATSATVNKYISIIRNTVFNGTTWDRQPGNTTGAFVVGNVASGAADSGNPVKVGGVYNTSAPTLSNGQRGDLQLDLAGNLRVVATVAGLNVPLLAAADNADAVAPNGAVSKLNVLNRNTVFNGTNWDRQRGSIAGTFVVPGGDSFSNIISNTTTVVKSGAGTLVRVICNNPGTTEVLTIYDNTAGSGTKIGTLSFGTGASSLDFGIAFATGLTIVSSGTATGDWTIVYR